MATINRVVIVGNLTRDPELRSTPNGSSVCRLRVACNTSWRNKDTGEFDERPNYFDVTVFGASGEACARFLAKGRPSRSTGASNGMSGRRSEGERRQAVGILADSVQFLAARQRDDDGDAQAAEEEEAVAF